MKRSFDTCRTLVGVIVLLMLLPTAAFAYIDPNTGGYVFQMLFPVFSVIAAVFLFFKNQAMALVRWIVRLVTRKRDDH